MTTGSKLTEQYIAYDTEMKDYDVSALNNKRITDTLTSPRSSPFTEFLLLIKRKRTLFYVKLKFIHEDLLQKRRIRQSFNNNK